jgi:hypothetical protein
VTETQLKLQDAATQMKIALQNGGNEGIFRSCINAFIAAARSITMVMERESNQQPELLAWYKTRTEELGPLPLFRFFNSQRTYTIHRGVVQPASRKYPVHKYERGMIEARDGSSLTSHTFTIDDDDYVMNPNDIFFSAGMEAMIVWDFPEGHQFFPGESSNVPRLCEEYFAILKALVYEWLELRTKLGIRDSL